MVAKERRLQRRCGSRVCCQAIDARPTRFGARITRFVMNLGQVLTP